MKFVTIFKIIEIKWAYRVKTGHIICTRCKKVIMAKLKYNLDRLEKCIFSLYEDIKTPNDILRSWDISEIDIEKTHDELISANALIGGSPICRIKMGDKSPFEWEFICDPPVDDNYEPLWNEVPQKDIEIIKNSEDLCSLLLIFAIENGNPSQYLIDTSISHKFLRPKFCKN